MLTPSQAGSPARYPGSITGVDTMSSPASLRTLTNTLAAGDQRDRVKDLFSVDIDPQSPIDGFDKVSFRFVSSPVTTLHGGVPPHFEVEPDLLIFCSGALQDNS